MLAHRRAGRADRVGSTAGYGVRLAVVSLVMRTRTVAIALLAMSSPASGDDDPLLAPVAAAHDQIRTWDDALARIRRAPDLLAAAADVDRATGERRIALAAVLPTLSVEHDLARAGTHPLPPTNVWSTIGLATWSIDARSIYAVGTATRAIDLAQLSLAEGRRELAAETIDTMLATLTTERIAERGRTSLRSAGERLELTRTRLTNGRGTELDVDRASQDLEAARRDVVQDDENVRRAREALGQILGSSKPLGASSDLDLEQLERAVASTCRPSAELEQRADVAQARSRLDLARREVTDAELRFSPAVGVSTELTELADVSAGPSSYWVVEATISLPLYDGGARYGALHAARAEVTRAAAALEQARIAALVDATRADRAIDVAVTTRDIAKRERELAARVDGRVREGYAAGLGTSLDLVTSAQALRQADIELATAEFQVARAQAAAVLAHAECVF
jgi:multidrug efflux system outer membrane protein